MEQISKELKDAIASLNQIQSQTMFTKPLLGNVCLAIADVLVVLLESTHGLGDEAKVCEQAKIVGDSLRNYARALR
ncbi:MAG: hypothetical protein AAGA30_09350 [Planctomycetota bacterium]